MEDKVKVGDILVGMWHYSMSYPVWFKVTRVMGKQANAVRLGSKMIRPTDGGYGQQGYEVPDEEKVREDYNGYPEKHTIRIDKYGLCTGSASRYDYFHLEKWDGQPRYADYMD